MQIVRASMVHLGDAEFLLREYYEALSVVKIDSEEDLHGYLCDPASGFWLAYVDDFPVGCVALRPGPHPAMSSECKRLYVRPRFRGHGVAKLLLDALEAEARANGTEWLYLDSTDHFKAALKLYVERGYKPCDRYNDNPQATVFLRKHLGASLLP